MEDREAAFPIALRTEHLFCADEVLGVDVKGCQVSAVPERFQQLSCVSAIAKRAVEARLPGLYLQNVQDLLHRDRQMHARRGGALGNHLFNGLRVLLRILFLVLLRIRSRVVPAVVWAPPVGRLTAALPVFLFHIHMVLPVVNFRKNGNCECQNVRERISGCVS